MVCKASRWKKETPATCPSQRQERSRTTESLFWSRSARKPPARVESNPATAVIIPKKRRPDRRRLTPIKQICLGHPICETAQAKVKVIAVCAETIENERAIIWSNARSPSLRRTSLFPIAALGARGSFLKKQIRPVGTIPGSRLDRRPNANRGPNPYYKSRRALPTGIAAQKIAMTHGFRLGSNQPGIVKLPSIPTLRFRPGCG